MAKETFPPFANAALLLADGKVFFGKGIGAAGVTTGEICFNTGMTGYQEVLTDLSYTGQIVTFTFPHIGNVGANAEDIESQVPHVAGLVVRECITEPSNFRSQDHLDGWLKKHGITGICGVDTRALTRHIRLHGAQNVLICHLAEGEKPDFTALRQRLAETPAFEGIELTAGVTTKQPYPWAQTRWQLGAGYGDQRDARYHVVAIDYGEKLNILRSLASQGCKVTVVPGATPAKDILALKPDGVFLSNGPGDPAATGGYAIPVLRELMDSGTPMFGICLGHQLLALALGAKTEKMHQGHRGANHPVKDLTTGKVEITSQNHGFCVCEDTLPQNVEVTHRSLFDGCVEGFRATDKPVFAVQYHPESSPGPHDSQYLFERFLDDMKRHAQKN